MVGPRSPTTPGSKGGENKAYTRVGNTDRILPEALTTP